VGDFGGDENIIAVTYKSLAEDSLALARTVSSGSIEVRDSKLNCPLNRLDHTGALRAISGRVRTKVVRQTSGRTTKAKTADGTAGGAEISRFEKRCRYLTACFCTASINA